MQLQPAFCGPIFLLVFCLPMRASVQPYDNARACVEYIQKARGEVLSLWSGEHPKREDLTKAITQYEVLLKYLDDPRVQKRFPDDLELRLKRQDLLGDLVAMHARAGDVKSVLRVLAEEETFLKACARGEGNPGFWVARWQRDPAVAALARQHPEVEHQIQRVARLEPHWALFKAAALATPYRETLPLEERLAGLTHLWAEAKYNFAYFDRVQIDWNQKLLEYIPLVTRAEDTWSYYRVLQRLIAELGDAHTNVYFPHELWKQRQSGRLPLLTRRMGDAVVVEAVTSPALVDVKVGDEIVAIDGQPVIAFAEREIAPYESCSTPQDKDVRVYGYSLLLGPPDKPVTLTLRRAGGVTVKVTLTRIGFKDLPPVKEYTFERRPDGIGIARISGFEGPDAARGLRADLRKHPDLKGLILDVRRNDGGDSAWAEIIIAGLIEKNVPMRPSTTRFYNPTLRAWGRRQNFTDLDPSEIKPSRQRWFSGPVVMLTGPRTFSAGEDFVAMFRAAQRGPVIGEATGGSTGEPLAFPLPGGGKARVCTKRDVLADGTEFVGVGIKPDNAVPVTLDDIRAGRDRALDEAIRYLSKTGQ